MQRGQACLVIVLYTIKSSVFGTCFFSPSYVHRYAAPSQDITNIISTADAPTRCSRSGFHNFVQRGASLVSESDFVLAKTTESFKLSDLYLLETKLESTARGWKEPESIGVDANTGSYLLKLDKDVALTLTAKNGIDIDHQRGRGGGDKDTRPPFLDRFDWITEEVIASGSSGMDLVHDIECKHQMSSLPNIEDDFTLDYICMGPVSSKEKDHTSKNLMCRVAQCIPASVALNPKKASHTLILIETPTQIYLAKRNNIGLNLEMNNVMKQWASRTYQYSSAINPTIALIVTDLLYDLTLRGTRTCKVETEMRNEQIGILDPTCGSGTFLAFSLLKGMSVVGYDIKEKCVAGSLQNLSDLIGEKVVRKKCKLIVDDFGTGTYSGIDKYYEGGGYHCAVTNLPWGQNTEIKNERDNKRILQRVCNEVRQGGYCAIISKGDVTLDLHSAGFKIIGSASVPPSNFVLPSSKKKKKPVQKKLDSSNCIISIVLKKDEV